MRFFAGTIKAGSGCFVALLLAILSATQVNAQSRTVVRVTTDLGAFDIALLDDLTPLSTANILAYVNASDYDGTFFHRAPKNADGTTFVVQGGNFRFPVGASGVEEITGRGTVNNEPRISNVRGTVAMAKLGGDPNSASNQWFVNMGDNSANLDNQNGGFTVFGTVIGDGMQVLDAIAALRIVDAQSPFNTLPVNADYVSGEPLTRDDLVYVQTAAVNSAPPPIAVPSLTGLSPVDAEQALVVAGLLAGARNIEVSSNPANRGVVRQSVAAGARVAPGTTVDFVVGVNSGSLAPILFDMVLDETPAAPPPSNPAPS